MLTVIGTSSGREDWAAEALASIPGEAIVVSVPGYELGKLAWVAKNTTFERFLFLQDSVIVTPELYSMLADYEGSVALLADPVPFGCYLGVYERTTLQQVGIPTISSKREAVEAEIWWTKAYCEAAGNVPVLFPELSDRNATRHSIRHGRENLVLENNFMAKFKGTWRHDQISG